MQILTGTLKFKLHGSQRHYYVQNVMRLFDDHVTGGLLGSILHILALNHQFAFEPCIRYDHELRDLPRFVCSKN